MKDRQQRQALCRSHSRYPSAPRQWNRLLFLMLSATKAVVLTPAAASPREQLRGLRQRVRSSDPRPNKMDPRNLQECSGLSEILCETSIFESFCELLMRDGGGGTGAGGGESSFFGSSFLSGNDDYDVSSASLSWTVFAPTNQALREILQGEAQDGNASLFLAGNETDTDNVTLNDDDGGFDFYFDDGRDWRDLIRFHLVRNRVLRSTDLVCDDRLVMDNGKATTVGCEGESNGDERSGRDALYLAGSGNPRGKRPRIVVADVVACDGIIHVIDGLLRDMPDNEMETEMTPSVSIAEAATPVQASGEPDPKPRLETVEQQAEREDCQPPIRKWLFPRSCPRTGRFVNDVRTSLRQSNSDGSRRF